MAELTPAQKAAATRRQHKAAQMEKRKQKESIVAALEAVIQDDGASRGAKEDALFLLAHVYRGW